MSCIYGVRNDMDQVWMTWYITVSQFGAAEGPTSRCCASQDTAQIDLEVQRWMLPRRKQRAGDQQTTTGRLQV